MPSRLRSVTRDAAFAHVRDRCMSSEGSERVGAEVEWLTSADGRQPSLDEMRLGPLPRGSLVTFEPGGQLEISTMPGTLGAVLDAGRIDACVARDALASHGISTLGAGLDRRQDVERLLRAPRYDAMERFFDEYGDHGRTMMRRTAAIQVNVDPGPRPIERWRLASQLGPVLAATFANSPVNEHRSGRLVNWFAIDPSRTAPARDSGDPRDAWARMTLDARVMLIRISQDRFVPMTNGLTFARWIDEGSAFGFPTLDDLDYHLTTLFPPLRARGWFELRMIDAQPDPMSLVPVALIGALLQDEDAAERAWNVSVPARGRWMSAATNGLRDPVLADAAVATVALALEALQRRVDVDRSAVATCEMFFERYTARGRCPADDLLDASNTSEAA